MRYLLFSLLFVSLAVFASYAGEIKEGQWEDGTSVQWQCQKNTQGTVLIQFKDRSGTLYQGEIVCDKYI